MDSLFANNILLLIFVKFIVGSNPAIPGIDAIVISIFLLEKETCL